MWWPFRRNGRTARAPPFLALNETDDLTLEQIAEGAFICGATGSGKTTGPGEELARAALRAGAGFCVLVAKPDEYPRWVRLCEQTGRSGDLVRFAPDSGLKCDLLNTELSHPQGTVAEACALLSALVDIESRQSEGGGDEQFWRGACDKTFRRAIHAVWIGRGRCSLTDVYRFLVSAPNDLAQTQDPSWITDSFCAACLVKLGEKAPNDYDAILTGDYWLKEWPALSDKTRSIVYTMATNVLDKFLFGDVARMVSSGETNFGPADILAGKVCVLDMPFLKWGSPARFFQILFKTLVQRATLRRDLAQSPTPVVVWQDEGQVFVTEFDVQVQCVARQARLLTVFMTQNLPVMYEAMGGGPKAEQQTLALIGNLQTKVLCQQGDRTTCEYFSGLLGSSRHLFGSMSINNGPYDAVGDYMSLDGEKGSYSLSEQWHPDVSPEAFTKLRKGGRENGYMVDAYVFQGGRRFSNGKTWVKGTFRQRI